MPDDNHRDDGKSDRGQYNPELAAAKKTNIIFKLELAEDAAFLPGNRI
jgi:hypothetical protein